MFTAKPPKAVSLYFSDISAPVWRMASMQLSNGMKCVPSPRSASDAADTALIAPSPFAFDAGHLHQPLNRVAGHAQMVFQREFGGVFDLLWRAAQHRGPPRRRPWQRPRRPLPDSRIQRRR